MSVEQEPVMTNPMKTNRAGGRGFTLIELLVVITIMAVLAALIFPAFGAIKRRATITKAQTELQEVRTAIELYKDKLGFYPPDNPGLPALNPLYYELLGTAQLDAATYETLDKTARVPVGSLARAFSGVDTNNNVVPSGVSGFINRTRGAGDESVPAKSFLRSLKPGQYAVGRNNGVELRLLTCTVPWPNSLPSVLSTFVPDDASVKPNPWRYVSSNPTNNPGSYDLWVDVVIRGKTNRISNWSQQAQIVATP